MKTTKDKKKVQNSLSYSGLHFESRFVEIKAYRVLLGMQ